MIPFLPTPGDSCISGLEREIELAEIGEPDRPGLACFRWGGEGERGGG